MGGIIQVVSCCLSLSSNAISLSDMLVFQLSSVCLLPDIEVFFLIQMMELVCDLLLLGNHSQTSSLKAYALQYGSNLF